MRLAIQVDGVTVSEKRTVNFVAGENVTVTVVDDGDSVNIEIAAS
jgi:hypothetical protein